MGAPPEEAVDQQFLNLDIGLPVERLRPMVRQVLATGEDAEEAQLSAVSRRGRNITVRVNSWTVPPAF